jgi:hypothetical protein
LPLGNNLRGFPNQRHQPCKRPASLLGMSQVRKLDSIIRSNCEASIVCHTARASSSGVWKSPRCRALSLDLRANSKGLIFLDEWVKDHLAFHQLGCYRTGVRRVEIHNAI